MADIFLLLEPNHDGNLVYYPGSVIKGVVELKITSVRKIRGLSVTFYGRGKTYWSDDETKRIQLKDGSYREQFNGKEIYIDSRKYLLGQQHGLFFEMTPGITNHNFVIELPNHLPSSLKLVHGDISYNVGAVLEISDLPDIEHLVPITIVRNDDIRLNRDLQMSFGAEYMHTACCCFCKSLPCYVVVTLPRTGFVSDEQIPIKIKYVNQSSRELSDTVIKLRCQTVFHSDTPKVKDKNVEETLAKFTVAGVIPQSSKIIEENLRIPPNLLNSNGEYSRYIRISYYLLVITDIITAPKLFVPITIGSTPIITDAQQHEAANSNLQPTPSAYALIPTAPEESFKNGDLPPSFAEVMSVNVSENSSLLQPATSSSIGWNYKR